MTTKNDRHLRTAAGAVGLTVDTEKGTRLVCYRFWVGDRIIGSAWTRSGALTWLAGYAAALSEAHRRVVA